MPSAGTFCTAILHTRDAKAAARFYNAILGWTLDGDRFMLRGQCASATGASNENVDRWVPYFANASMQTRALAIHRDLEGAVFGTCAPDDPRAVTLTSGPGSIWWVEVLTHKVSELKAFYSGVFQWTYVDRAPFLPHPLYIICMRGEQQATGILPIGPGWDQPARWQVLFEVEDLEQSTALVLGAGGSLHFGPLDVPGVCVLTSFLDPQGALFLLAQPRKRTA
jgi:predicted enzyme related to lactoylglutathione lyase